MPATSTPRSGSTSRSRADRGVVSCSGHARAPTPDRHGHLPVHGHRRFDQARPGARACRLRRTPRAAQRHPPRRVRAARRHRAGDAGRFLPRAVHRGTCGGRGGRGCATRPERSHVAGRRGGPRPDGSPLGARHAGRRRLRGCRHPPGRPDIGRGARRAGARIRCDAVPRGGPVCRMAWSCCPSASTSCATSIGRNRSTRFSARAFGPSSRRSSRLVARAVATSRPA